MTRSQADSVHRSRRSRLHSSLWSLGSPLFALLVGVMLLHSGAGTAEAQTASGDVARAPIDGLWELKLDLLEYRDAWILSGRESPNGTPPESYTVPVSFADPCVPGNCTGRFFTSSVSRFNVDSMIEHLFGGDEVTFNFDGLAYHARGSATVGCGANEVRSDMTTATGTLAIAIAVTAAADSGDGLKARAITGQISTNFSPVTVEDLEGPNKTTCFLSSASLGGGDRIEAAIDVTFFREDGLGDYVKDDETAPVRMRVTNNTGGDLRDVRLGEVLIKPDGTAGGTATIAGPESPLPTTIGTGSASLGFADFELTGVEEGPILIEATVNAVDGSGSAIKGTAATQFNVRSTPLTVSITLDPAEFTLEEGDDAEEPEPVEVTASLMLTNNTEAPLTSVVLRSLDVARTVVGQPLLVTQLSGVQPDPIDGLPLLESLAPGATAGPFEAVFLVEDDGDLKFSAVATAADSDNQTVTGSTEAFLKVAAEKYIELTARVATPPSGTLLKAGEEIVIDGTIRNLSNTATLELGPLFPYLEGNTGIMSLAYDGAAPEPEALVPPGNLTLDIAQTRTFQLRIKTNYSDPRNFGAAPSGGTRARVRFEPWGIATEADGSLTELRTYEGDYVRGARADAQVRATGPDLELIVSIDDSIALPETEWVLLSAGIFKGTIVGTYNAAVALVYGLVDLVKMPYTTLRGAAAYQQKVWDSFTEEERQLFVDETSFMIVSVLQRNVELGKQDAAELYQQVDAYTLQMMTDLANEWETGDYVSVAEKYAAAGSEVIGSVALPIGLAKLAQTPRAQAALARAQTAIQTRMAPVLAATQELRIVDNALPLLQALENGAHLNLDEIAKLYGIGADEVAELQRLATKYKFLITVRSRHPSSIKWIRQFGAMLKPEAIKIKSVSELDVRLGYRIDDLGAVVFKKPAPLQQFDRAGGNLDELVESFIQGKGFTPGTPDYDNAVNRMNLRIKEWGKHEIEYRRAHDRGWIETEFNYTGNAIPDNRTGAERGQFTGFKLQEVGEDEFRVLLLDASRGRHVPITGDIDPIAFTHTDGSPLTPAEHKKLLDEMRESSLLIAQHGESATFTRGGVDFIAGQFKPNEPGLQFAPNAGQSRVVRFDPGKSRWNNAEDYNLHWEGGFIDAGASPDLVQRAPVNPDFARIPLGEGGPATVALPVTASEVPTVGRCRVNFSATASATRTFISADGVLSTLTPEGEVAPHAESTTCFTEGAIVDITAAPTSSLATGTGDRSGRLPSYVSAQPAGAAPVSFVQQATGAATIQLTEGDGAAALDDGDGFEAGQQIAIGVGTDQQEIRTIESIEGSTVTLDEPLSEPHEAGEVVLMIEPAPGDSNILLFALGGVGALGALLAAGAAVLRRRRGVAEATTA